MIRPTLALAALTLAACAQNPQQAQRQMLDEQAKLATTPAPGKNADARGTYVALVSTLLDQNSNYAALSHLDALEGKYGSDAQTQLLRARAERATGKTDAAQRNYEQLLQGPQRSAAEHGLALIYAGRQQWDQARRYFDAASRDAPTNPFIWNDLGYLALMRGDWDTAAQALSRAVELSPSEPRFRANLALYRQLSTGSADPDIPADVAQRIQGEARQWQQPGGGLQLAQTLSPTP
ncbi:tetratricopeptide repeat protein [Jeongeupia naejangsanensis]|uniref:Tetratricopeptide repeat protein n=1 Tax=Jeongeupia naejangsanensis TaxID=613195 RepID=A0ABS2BJS1_9NEIS|nr:tetratricopeptide repeat protein [Jeongeupia naejangsanensis]MBM3115859.1 tetratricopeptide repeat protein [Jeongeupia naejangsanensis]